MTKVQKDRLGAALIAVILLGMLGAAGFALRAHQAERAVDSQTLCPIGQQPVAVTEVLIDLTDPFSSDQARAMRQMLRHLAQVELRRQELLSVWGVGDFEDGSLRRLFTRCNPGRESNWFYQDPVAIEARFDSLFGDTLARLAASLTLTQHASRSPLIESIQELSELPELCGQPGPRRIILISDMLQNSSRFSQYRRGSNYEAFRRSRVFSALRADLHGTTVEVVYLPRKRDAALQGPEHREFWRHYLRDCQAAQVAFTRL